MKKHPVEPHKPVLTHQQLRHPLRNIQLKPRLQRCRDQIRWREARFLEQTLDRRERRGFLLAQRDSMARERETLTRNDPTRSDQS